MCSYPLTAVQTYVGAGCGGRFHFYYFYVFSFSYVKQFGGSKGRKLRMTIINKEGGLELCGANLVIFMS